MDSEATFMTDTEVTMLVEPGDGPLNRPAVHPQSTAVFGPVSRCKGDNMPPTQLVTVGLGIAGPVPLNSLWTPAGPSRFAHGRRDARQHGPIRQGLSAGISKPPSLSQAAEVRSAPTIDHPVLALPSVAPCMNPRRRQWDMSLATDAYTLLNSFC
jgi:hypothetical protein